MPEGPYCDSCGMQVDPRNTLCTGCGARITGTGDGFAPGPDRVIPVVAAPPPPQPPPAPRTSATEREAAPDRHPATASGARVGRLPLVLAGVVVLVVAVVLGVTLGSRSGDQDRLETAGGAEPTSGQSAEPDLGASATPEVTSAPATSAGPAPAGPVADFRCWSGDLVQAPGACPAGPDRGQRAFAWVFPSVDFSGCQPKTTAGRRIYTCWFDGVEFNFSRWERAGVARAHYTDNLQSVPSDAGGGRIIWDGYRLNIGQFKAAAMYAASPWSISAYADDRSTALRALREYWMRPALELRGARE